MRKLLQTSILIASVLLLGGALHADDAALDVESATGRPTAEVPAAPVPASGFAESPLLDAIAGLDQELVYMSGPCTVTYTCPGGQQIQCSGNTSCATTNKACSDGGSTCPGQGGTVKAVNCDGGPIEDHCDCPVPCYGCGASCTDDWDCQTVCSCGPGFCSGGQCECVH